MHNILSKRNSWNGVHHDNQGLHLDSDKKCECGLIFLGISIFDFYLKCYSLATIFGK